MLKVEAIALGERRRIAWLAIVFAIVGFILVGRVAWWQLFPHDEIVPPFGTANVIPAARGSILDATGHYLVTSTVKYRIGVSPRLLSVTQKEALIPKLSTILNLPQEKVREVLYRENTEYSVFDRGSPFDRDFDLRAAEQIEALPEADAFSLQAHFPRVYPDDGLAASLLGFVDRNGQPQYGLEQYYNKDRTGTVGIWHGISDAWGEQIMAILRGYQPAKDGADLVLTVDRNVQLAAEVILREGIEQNKATSGNIIVMDPRTGAILAMANYPSYRPGAYWEVPKLDYFVNTSISAIYEPGSVLKAMTLASGLEARVIRPDSTYDDRGEIIVGNQRIFNSDRKAHGITTMTQLLAYSLNVGSAHVATLIGATRFYEYMKRFGFGEVTGIDLALEVPGIMRVPGNPFWHLSDLGTNSFGQGISTTPIQVVTAFAALANGGMLIPPRVVAEIRDGERVTVPSRPPSRRVVSTEVSQQVSKLLADAVELGLKQATLPGYRIAGKSGTSGIPDQEGYKSRDIIASFVGYGPLPNPRFVILVKYDKPREGVWGGEVAAPAFRRMMKFLVDYYGIPPTTAP